MVAISLQNQVHIYSVDTNDFHHEDENVIYEEMKSLFIRQKKIKDMRNSSKYKNILHLINIVYKNINAEIKELKEELQNTLEKNSNMGKVRTLDPDVICDKNIISIFESTLTRSLELEHNDLTDELIVVQTFYFTVLEDIIKNGFVYNDEKYVVYTASAGQIRTKKTVFIKEKSLDKIRDKLMCGLTEEIINQKGGINTNKYLAYLALSNSATDLWEDFDIDKAIVVNDFETEVISEVDFIHNDTYKIERKSMGIDIEHTDGSGMVLPSVTKKNTMVRLPWIKGLLVPFPFDKFIRESNRAYPKAGFGKVEDIYGKEYDIIEDDIQIIFTKSQFKMWKYYDSWDEFKINFKKYNCEAGTCNEEEDEFTNADINYQMLQTLTDMTDDELVEITEKTREKIYKIMSDRKTMLDAFGVSSSKKNKTYVQEALEIYPELLKDPYMRDTLRKIKKSMVKKAYAGKFEIEGKYTFICPDMYAFCEHLFLGIEKPNGLLKDGEVFCSLYKHKDKLDCLRSPHLYREHAVRRNICVDDKDRYREIKRWFITSGIYTSSHDSISKLLMFDTDGDKCLVCAEETIIRVAEEHMDGIVPLYYNMAKAGSHELNNDEIFRGLKTAYVGGNIGMISNDITKIWNSDEVTDEAIEAVKLLCMENNFVIDYAKTLYKLERPKDKHSLITKYTKKKLPHFFLYAKDKKKYQVCNNNDSVINRLQKIIPNPNIKFSDEQLGDFNIKMLLSDKNINIEVDKMIVREYDRLNSSKRYISAKAKREDRPHDYIYFYIRNHMIEKFGNIENVVDNLVCELYMNRNTRYKETLWQSFGDILVKNLNNNIDKSFEKGYILCERCGVRIKKKNNKMKYCKTCFKIKEREWKRNYKRKNK